MSRHILIALFTIGFGVQAAVMTLMPALPDARKGAAYLLHTVGLLLDGAVILCFLFVTYHNQGLRTPWCLIYATVQTVLACLTLAPFTFFIGFLLAEHEPSLEPRGFELAKAAFCLLLVGLFCVALVYVATRHWAYRLIPALGVTAGQALVAFTLPRQAGGLLYTDLWLWRQNRRTKRLRRQLDKLLRRPGDDQLPPLGRE